MAHPRIASFATPRALRQHLAALALDLPLDDTGEAAPRSSLARPLDLGQGRVLANRFVIQPMEGWDGTPEGGPSDLTRRRWRNFGRSGAAWIWGGEAVAVCPEGRANPRQMVIDAQTSPALANLRRELLQAASEAGHPRPFVGLQLTHSGRWSRPSGTAAPRIAFRHPLLDRRGGVANDDAVLSDTEVEGLIEVFARSARLAADAGFDFVDLKHCHGYLLHEFLAARRRPGPFGGVTLEERTHLLRRLLAAMRDAAPALPIAVRLSAFDAVPHVPAGVDGAGRLGVGVAEQAERPYAYAFGLDSQRPESIDLDEPIRLVALLVSLGVRWINVTAGSPYYVPHIQRPALFPPSDGYAPPEDPLCGVARLLGAARAIKRAVPDAVVVGSGWTYLQEYLPHAAQACVRDGWCDAVGLGRMVLSYPQLPADVLAGGVPERRRLCRTFSDCTSAPRQGLVSGCYPLDPYYRALPERKRLEEAKAARRGDP